MLFKSIRVRVLLVYVSVLLYSYGDNFVVAKIAIGIFWTPWCCISATLGVDPRFSIPSWYDFKKS